jgi:23S rRNA pseudouridine1911/1915/1917 synthase
MAVTQTGGREAHTSYRVLEQWKDAAHVEMRLDTGRTHQIRVHLEHLGCPVLGDMVYGKRQNRRLKEMTGYIAPRQLLHAVKLALVHPRTRKRMIFAAPLPEDFAVAINFFGVKIRC